MATAASSGSLLREETRASFGLCCWSQGVHSAFFPDPYRGCGHPGQGGCSGWKAEGGRARTGTGSCPGPQMLSCTCSHWVSPPTSSWPRSDVQSCAPVGIHLVLCEPCHASFLMVPQTGNPVWTSVSELCSSCVLKREDLGKHLGDGQRRRGLLAVACPWRAKSLCPSTA